MERLGLRYRLTHSTIIVRVVASIVMAFLSVGAISLIERLPYSHARDVASDALKLPAYLIVEAFSPEGIHWSHPIFWAHSGIGALYGMYAVFWFAIVSFLARRRTDARR